MRFGCVYLQKLGFLYTNADTLRNEFPELRAIAGEENLDLICIAETLPKVRDNPDLVQFELKEYNQVRHFDEKDVKGE